MADGAAACDPEGAARGGSASTERVDRREVSPEVGCDLGDVMAFHAARVVDKPWGREVWWAQTSRYTGKLLEVRSGHRLSLQYHREKLETLVFLQGAGEVQLGERRMAIYPGLNVTIHPGNVHRVSAESDVVFMEVSSPEVEDVVRLEDRYGRAGRGDGTRAPVAVSQ